ncbi:hypothetical protein ESZ36_17100 [Colwellia demingiae]|uniref:Uncharacterized protein n=1 Tax=Colwellia demingiae TaxID=89401 RepID=A0A5C6Q9U9_9GAMM|nr:hypothetical protein [Colwellia demingiae]TWX65523.1 hypothetical protein ESZ36_17100 [Colwellia demingiae]
MCNSNSVGLTILFAVALSGCSSTPQHSNTLIFSTTTKVAIDISAEPTTGSPDITIGYKRVEGVWMPLLANEEVYKGNAKPAKCGKPDCVFQSNETNKDGSKKTDTYSVLATLGAEFGGEAKTGSAAASGGISQFFATGIAAQKLAESGGSRLVTVQPTSAIEAQLQKERADKAEAKVSTLESELKESLGSKQYQAIVDDAKNTNTLNKNKINLILSTVAPGNILNQNLWKLTLGDSALMSNIEKAEKGLLENCADIACIEQRLSGYLNRSQERRNIIDKINKAIWANS